VWVYGEVVWVVVEVVFDGILYVELCELLRGVVLG